MTTIHNAIIKDGGIFIPNFDLNDPKITGKLSKKSEPLQEFQVKIRVIKETKTQQKKKSSLAGVFAEYANPDLIEKEKEAWAMAVVDKYANS